MAVVTTGLALSISMNANAGVPQPQSAVEREIDNLNQGSKRSSEGAEQAGREYPADGRIPLLLPHPTKIYEQNKYGLG